ncbi:MAG: 1-acyl-sn-glycerol-3-phosphate acyltransferase [Williamsia sp.]|nr:1-acyl-sn-glycerol-3-phosphate acyltransferase [Williamsia sp.]
MKILYKLVHALYVLWAGLLFIMLMFVVVLLVIPASFFGRIRGGNFIYQLCRAWGGTWFALIGIRQRNIYLAPHDPHRACIFVANHISYMDIPAIIKALQQPTRILGKAEMAKIPVFGYIYSRAAVMVDRSSPDHRARSVKILKSVLKKGISIMIFPEGTFNLTEQPLKDFYDGAFRIAIETGTPIKPVLLPDTLARLHYRSIFSLTPGRMRAVFMDEVGVEGLTLADMPALKAKVHALMTEQLTKLGYLS